MNELTLRTPDPSTSLLAGFAALVVTLAAATVGVTAGLVAPWLLMWSTAIVTLMGLKVTMFCDVVRRGGVFTAGRTATFFLAWPGLDAEAFTVASPPATGPLRDRFAAALACCTVGATLLWIVVPRAMHYDALGAAWVGMIALVLLLHFGSFGLAAVALRRFGFDVEPLMDQPLAARSLADFWGRRWNRAFRRTADRLVYRPTARRFGATAAVVASFFFSGVIHDVVISLPARGGYGGPTAYFLIQALGVLAAHSGWGRRLRLHQGWTARLFAAVVLVAPLGLLFHRPFALHVVLPFLRALGCA